MTTTTACPKCGYRLRAESDHYGSYVRCIICSYTKDDEPAHEEGDYSMKYIGNLLPMASRRVPYQEIFQTRGKTNHVVKRIILCPRNHLTVTCHLEMAATGNTFERASADGNRWVKKNTTRVMNEYACERGHVIGIAQGWIGWIERGKL